VGFTTNPNGVGMRRLTLATALVGGLLALSCTDEGQEGPTEPPSIKAAPTPCPSSDPIQSQICALFPPPDLLKSASDLYNNLNTKLRQGRTAEAQARAFDLVNFTFKQFYAGKLLDPNGGGSSPTTWEAVVILTCDVLDKVGDDCGDLPSLPPSSPSSHATTQVCGPAGCLVLPEDKHSGVSIPAGACPSPCIISVNPIPATSPRQGPLVTQLDQYLLFRDYALSASFNEFAKPVLVGICHLDPGDGDFAPPDAATERRLQLAHPDPSGEGIEILDKVAAPFLDCSDFDSTDDEVPSFEEEGGSFLQGRIGSAGRALGRALVPVLQRLLPEPAEAAMVGGCCLGGLTSKFSPFAAVDPFSGPNILSGVNSSDDGLSLINSQSGEVSFVGRLDPNPNLYATPIAMGVRPSDGELFVWNNSGDGTEPCCASTGVLLTVDPSTGQGTPVSTSTPPQGSLGALAFSPGGDLFGVATALYSVSTTTGVKTQIGSGLGSGLNVAAADFDCNGTLYGVELTLNSTQRLVTINTTTGAATVVRDLSTDIGRIGSILFTQSGTLIGSSFGGPSGNILFDIDQLTGTVSNIRSTSAPPQGLGVVRTCGPIIE
jgi:hypothetical protein